MVKIIKAKKRAAPKPRKRRHWRRLAAVLLCSAGALAALAISQGSAEARGRADIAIHEWQRLVRGIAHRAGSAEAPAEPAHSAAGLNPATPLESVTPPSPAAALPARPAPAVTATADDELDLGRREILVRQAIDYDARRPKTVVELQKFRRTQAARIAGPEGKGGKAVLINLNPRANSWYLLQLTWDGGPTTSYHLTNVAPRRNELLLDATFPGGLVIRSGELREGCALWADGGEGSLLAASQRQVPYVTLCGDQLALRRPTAGRRTHLEWAADFLRDNVWSGEALTVLVRSTLFRDSQLAHGERRAAAPETAAGAGEAAPAAGRPLPARIVAPHAGESIAPAELGLALADAALTQLPVGAWEAAKDNAGVFVSALEPGLVPEPATRRGARRLAPLDEVESGALVLLVAFDLARFDLGFAIGTDHPRVGWSDRVKPGQFDEALPGPDGIADIAPLVPGGMVPFSLAERTTATFTAGFKRSHGAFRTGPLADRNFGSHYGFIEDGVVLSKLQPGLATVYVLDDGTASMKTWAKADNALLERIDYARQNGVAILENDPATGQPAPGELVGRWADGNWSGSQDKKLRSVRAGICLQESAAGRFLLYGYFSSATPSAMARVFAAYGCSYAMTTDMNALEHTYLALYRVEDSKLQIDHLIQGMDVLDEVVDGQTLPRFLGFADNRDFFYLVRREAAEETRNAAAGP